MAERGSSTDSYLPPGTRVIYDGIAVEDGGPESGVVVHCWRNHELDIYDCYIAFFGNEFPSEQPKVIPYILRYAAMSLTVVGNPVAP